MRVLIFHGYLLAGTGSNVYNARLAQALVGLGHEVHLLSQDRHPDRLPFVDAIGDFDDGRLRVRVLREPVRCTVYRPDIGDLLPVYVADRYEGIQARVFGECSDREVDRYVDANVRATSEVCELAQPETALANHLIMGPAILARSLTGSGTPYAVKVHGSALEYTVKRDPARFLPYAREGLAPAAGILVGSLHTARSLWEALGDPSVRARTRLGPPGVDVAHFQPRPREQAVASLEALAGSLRSQALRDQAGGGPRDRDSAFARDELAAAEALGRIDAGHDRPVAFVGKLIFNKGVDLLIAAWPLVLERLADARLVIVGFGADRDWLESLLDALATADLRRARERAGAHLRAHLDGLQGERRDRYLEAARRLPERVIFTGRLDHDELAELLPACEALVMPSTFPEAFGMVAAEAAACGALPISAAHSGMAEVSDALAEGVPAGAAQWLSFPVDDDVVSAIAGRLIGWLNADPRLREQTRAGLVATVRAQWSWESVAQRVIAAAEGRLDQLAVP
jgi:glycosyltransferase involved in cell wall biosynthesis